MGRIIAINLSVGNIKDFKKTTVQLVFASFHFPEDLQSQSLTIFW